MKLGANWSSPRELNYIKNIINDKRCHYVEILIDNFLNIDPREVKNELKGKEVSFHIMSSMFLTSDQSRLKAMAKKINYWIDVLSPINISDHLAIFEVNGNLLPMPMELDYFSNSNFLLEKINNWNKLLSMDLQLENYPSYTNLGNRQVDFFELLNNELGINALFDISNAVVASKNIGFDFDRWKKIYSKGKNFHCAGYREVSDDNSILVIDSHDVDISKETTSKIKKIFFELNNEMSLTIERDFNKDKTSWSKNADYISKSFFQS